MDLNGSSSGPKRGYGFYEKKESPHIFHAVHGTPCQILTGIPKPYRGIITAKEDKREWGRRLISPDVIVNVVLRNEKPLFCTGPDCILVDDFITSI